MKNLKNDRLTELTLTSDCGVAPHFEASGVRLYRGDCLQLLPRLQSAEVDLVLADPPYCSGAMTTAGRSADPRTKYCQNGRGCWQLDRCDSGGFSLSLKD